MKKTFGEKFACAMGMAFLIMLFFSALVTAITVLYTLSFHLEASSEIFDVAVRVTAGVGVVFATLTGALLGFDCDESDEKSENED